MKHKTRQNCLLGICDNTKKTITQSLLYTSRYSCIFYCDFKSDPLLNQQTLQLDDWLQSWQFTPSLGKYCLPCHIPTRTIHHDYSTTKQVTTSHTL